MASATPIGRLNQRVRIEQSVQVPDGQGGHLQSWSLRAVVWALVEPLTARELLLAQQLTAVLNTAVTIWWRADIHVTDRILLGTRTLMISSYQDPTGEHDELRILCAEVQDAPRTGVPLPSTWIQTDWVQP